MSSGELLNVSRRRIDCSVLLRSLPRYVLYPAAAPGREGKHGVPVWPGEGEGW